MINTEILQGSDNGSKRKIQVLSLFPPNSLEKTGRILTQMRLGFIVLDDLERIVECNSLVQQFFGIDSSIILHRPVEQLISLLDHHESDYSLLVDFLQTVRTEHNEIEIDWRGERLLIKRILIHEENCEAKGRFFVIENRTKQYSLEQQVRAHNRLATIGQIAAGTAHEIRNPLTSIRGFLQVIGHKLKENGQQKERGYIDIMLKEISRINNLVSEFLLLSKPRHIQLKTVKIEKILNEILPIIRSEAIYHNIEVKVEKKRDLFASIQADGELLKQVILNLCKNAIEAMGDGGKLVIRLTCLESEDFCLIEIIDNGPGIPDQLKEKIFEPFFTTKENGTGLGLSICQQILREIGGSIKVDSDHMGTKFSVALPVLQVERVKK